MYTDTMMMILPCLPCKASNPSEYTLDTLLPIPHFMFL